MIDVACNLCGRDDWQVRYPASQIGAGLDVSAFRCTSPGYGHHPQIVQCNHCGHVYANPRWSPADLIQAYAAVEDEVYLREREGRVLTFQKHLQALERRIGPANGRSLLDVGAYVGVFVEVANGYGWQASGVEPSAWAAGQASKQGLNVVQGTQATLALKGCRFDAITMWDVIEHLDDPSHELALAFQLLKPGGYLVVHTMDIDSPVARLMGSRWPWLMDMHLHYFSRRSLARMMEQNGFEILWSGAQGRYLRLGYLATRVSALSRPLGRLLSAVVAGPGLRRIAIPINFGDLFTVYARRPAGMRPD